MGSGLVLRTDRIDDCRNQLGDDARGHCGPDWSVVEKLVVHSRYLVTEGDACMRKTADSAGKFYAIWSGLSCGKQWHNDDVILSLIHI